MAARWKQGYEPKVILKQLEQSLTKREDGQVSFQGFAFTPYSAVITTMLDLGKIPDTEAHRLVSKSIFNAARSGGLSPDAILSEVDSLIRVYFKQSLNKYHLITSLSFGWRAKPSSFSLTGTKLRFDAQFRRYAKARREAI